MSNDDVSDAGSIKLKNLITITLAHHCNVSHYSTESYMGDGNMCTCVRVPILPHEVLTSNIIHVDPAGNRFP